MKWTGLNELREKYLSFFESKAHTRLSSFPLVPIDDNSLLLINSGMAPLKKYFLGLAVPPSKRVTTCQKCIRTPDIENVGKTARHGTFFEMLGNFSFGDYFKEEATAWAWEFITEVIELPVDKLWVTIYQDDDEAFDIWTKKVGVAPDRIVRLGKADNFWEHGTGPCGPCSEIYFDRGEKYGCGSPDCKPGCDCDRYIEFWNLVFTQFDSDGKGTYTPLDNPNIDTGMGLERLACVMQSVDNLFEVDTVQNIMKKIGEIAKVTYGKDQKSDISLRVITDHIRSTTFMIGDGVVPQNEGRGYVLRRLLRRAARHGRLLGITEPFLYKVCETVIEENKTAYPELVEKAGYIKKVIEVEEERFAKTVDQGMDMLNEIIEGLQEDVKQGKTAVISGEDAFKLYDTFGFPIDLTREIAEEKGIGLDEAEFEALMKEQKQRARDARSANDTNAWGGDAEIDLSAFNNEFLGYTKNQTETQVLAVIKDGDFAEKAESGEKATLLLLETPFYAESGGQVGDTGVLSAKGFKANVLDCKKSSTGQFMHICEITEGTVKPGQIVTATIDTERRAAIRRNHTSAHLLQAALRNVLGEHVHQAGSYVDEHRMRFDFSHFSAVTPEELKKVENQINEVILSALPVEHNEMNIADAKAMGAMALFGEKYGDVVRVCNIDNYSVELCGGTHVDNTARLGLFKIVSESSVAAGVRRIEGVTGFGVLDVLNNAENTIAKAAENLKLSNLSELVSKTEAVANELKAKDKIIEELNGKVAESKLDSIFANAKDVAGVSMITASFKDMASDALKAMADKIKDKSANIVAVISSQNGEKANLMVVCGADAVKAGLHAGKLVKEIATLTGGSGGGRPDSAMAGVGDVSKLDEAIAKSYEIIENALKK